MARILEQLDESPEKVMFGKLLIQLGNQSEDRVRSAAKQVPLELLRDIIYQFQVVLESRKGEHIQKIANDLKAEGISVEDLIQRHPFYPAGYEYVLAMLVALGVTFEFVAQAQHGLLSTHQLQQ